jgi:DNA-binding CsgD family transcriptional regulator
MNWTSTALDARAIRMKAQRQSLSRRERPGRLPEAAAPSRPGSRLGTHLTVVRTEPASETGTDSLPFAPDAIVIPASDQLELAFGLTSREAEIARLLVWGDSNKAIARKLSIQPGTVRKHVEHVLRKIDACSRRAVARVVLGLAEPV